MTDIPNGPPIPMGEFRLGPAETPRESVAVAVDGPDREHPCGCVTFWHSYTRQPGTARYRRACAAHRGYARRAGLLVAPQN